MMTGEDFMPIADALSVPFFSASELEGLPVPMREWLVPGFVPGSDITILGGDGGTGKSLLALQLCSNVVLDRHWLGKPVKSGKALYFGAEDDRDELHRRLAAIAASEGVGLAEMHGLTIRCLAGEDAVLAAPDPRSSVMTMTPLFTDLEDAVAKLQPVLIVLDNLADIFAGNENDRTQVRQFVGRLRGLALRHQCAIVVLAHPSLSGLSSGRGSSGSTGWNNSSRSRLYLKREDKAADGSPVDPDVRYLEVMKANYGRVNDTITVRWRDGVFFADGEKQMDFISRNAAMNQADEMFLTLLHRLASQGRHVSDATGRNSAPAVFAEQPDNGGINRNGFRNAMNRLFAAGKIRVATYGPPSKQRRHIEAVEALR